MSTLGRHLLVRATVCVLKGLLCFWPLVFLAALNSAATRSNPLIAMRPMLALEIAGVLSAPLVFAVAAAGGAALLQAQLHEARESVAAQLGGLSPWSVLRWTLVPSGILSAASLFLLLDLHPAAARTLHGSFWIDPELIPEMMERLDAGARFDHLAYSGHVAGDGAIEDFRLFIEQSDDSPVALAAASAEFELSDAGDISLELTDGVAAGGISGEYSVTFDEARIGMDLEALIRRGQRRWARADSRPMSALATDRAMAARVVSGEARRMGNRYAIEPWYRIILGLLPLIAASQVVFALAGLSPLIRKPAVTLVAFMSVSLCAAWTLATARSIAAEHFSSALLFLALVPILPGLVARLLVRLLSRSG